MNLYAVMIATIPRRCQVKIMLYHYQMDASLLKPRRVSSTFTHDCPLLRWKCCGHVSRHCSIACYWEVRLQHHLRYGSLDFLAKPLLSSIFSTEIGDAFVELFNTKSAIIDVDLDHTIIGIASNCAVPVRSVIHQNSV